MKLSVLIPMYNEKNIAENTARTLVGSLAPEFGDDFEIVFSDDGSTDGCGELVKALDLPNIRVVSYPDNRGKGSAVREGIKKCVGDVIVCTDCDLAYGTDAIIKIYNRIISGGEHIIIGSRNIASDGYEGYTFLRKMMSKTYIKLVSLIAGFRYSDSQCGLKCYCIESARSIFEYCTVNGFAFDLEALLLSEKFGMKIAEVPVKIINHRESTSKVHPFRDSVKMIRDVKKMKKRIKKLKI
ncbi:MAG: glycosyltransferase [Ruminococcaceae bacterium]|nr:glycosyltransferase [Oscillospiraceae bacterium]